MRRLLIGPPRDIHDPHIRHKLSLVALLAWVGLGADGLSSSAYGPEEAYRALAGHAYLVPFLVLATAATVFIISYAYSKIIEYFPTGGGGYLVSTQLLGNSAGVVSGCALLVDYVLTITVSIAGGGNAVFSLLPLAWQPYKLWLEYAAIALLIVTNLRGVKESVTLLAPIFLMFIATHCVLILGGALYHLADAGAVMHSVGSGVRAGAAEFGVWGLFVIFVRAYSLGGGTYTGIEAVSNGVAILREPRVETGKRTMLYMAISLALTAGGLLLCYMLARVVPVEGQTLNTVLAQQLAGPIRIAGVPIGKAFVYVTMASEAVLLLVAAQTGFIDGPRVMANMAIDNWLPRRFAALSDRLTTQNGIVLIGAAALVMLLYTGGHIDTLVVMYSINVFLTFSLSEFGMSRLMIRHRVSDPFWKRSLLIHATGFVLCISILTVMLVEKLGEGGWITLLATGSLIVPCFLIRRHYTAVGWRLAQLNADLALTDHLAGPRPATGTPGSSQPTAVVLVGGYSGVGVHTLLNVQRAFPGLFGGFLFVSVGVVDSGAFKGHDAIDALRADTQAALQKYVALARRLGFPAGYRMAIGTEVVDEAERLCMLIRTEFPRSVFFTGQLLFRQDRWYQRFLHNQTAFAIQKRLQWNGVPMVILPVRVRD
ncbi:MAG TPA: APC family permease [Phycisphaerae bacterium]